MCLPDRSFSPASADQSFHAGPPRRKSRPGKLLVRAALAGGLASGITTLAMFPLVGAWPHFLSGCTASAMRIVHVTWY